MKKRITFAVVGVLLLAVLAWAGTTNFDAVTVAPTSADTYGVRVDNTSGTRVYSVDGSGNVYIAGTETVTGVLTAPSAVLATPTITSPKMRIGFTSYAYSSGLGSTYSVASTDASPGVYLITGGSGTSTLVMTYTGTAATNAGKLFYIINSSSNSVQFIQSGGAGVTVATQKLVTIVGDGANFQRITADQ